MKKHILLFSIGCLMLTPSCVELDQEPKSFLTEEEYIKIQRLEIVEKNVAGLALNLWSENYGLSCRLLRYETAAGDLTPQIAKPNNDMLPLYNMNPGTGTVPKDLTALWDNFWKVISSSNLIINGTVIPEDENGPDPDFEACVAEARFMRALSYFYLVRIFGDVPKIMKAEDGMKDGILQNVKREKVETIYNDIILPDLDYACKKLRNKSRTGSSDSPSIWAAKTLLADVYITMAGWPVGKGTDKEKEYYRLAAETAQDVIENSSIELTKPYSDLWKEEGKENIKEHLFAVHNSVKNNIPSQYGKSFYPSDHEYSGWGDYFVNADFVKNHPDDDRKKYNYLTEWKNPDGINITYEESDNKSPLLVKFKDYNQFNTDKNGKQVLSQLSNGLTPIYRLADAYLIYAEASALAYEQVTPLAQKCMEDIWNRAEVKPEDRESINTWEELDEAVFKERGYEFIGETGKRWFEIIRRERAATYRQDVYNNSIYKANGHYYLPIPIEEIQMTGWTNNPGY